MLTREKVLAMEAGKEMDKLIAEQIMGWQMYHYNKDVSSRCYYMLVDEYWAAVANDIPFTMQNGERKTEEEAWNDNKPFSTDISAAWEVLENPEIMDKLQIGVYPTSFGTWIARKFMAGGKDCTVMNKSAALAICKCALLTTLTN